MTAQGKLLLVENSIRKALPRLMEPTEGCKLNFKKKYFLESVEGQVIKNYNKYVLVYSKEYDDTFLRAIEHCEIFGHDILLSDVLEWLGTLFHFSIDHKGIIYKEFDYYFEGGLDRDYTEVARVDFSKPRLADQSEELWKFLYNLLEDNE